MRIAWNALQKAAYEVLLADPALSALVGTQIYDRLPDPPILFPFVILGEFESELLEDKAGMQSPSLLIEARSIERGKKEVNDCLDAVLAALGGIRLSLDGFSVYSAGLFAGAGGEVEAWDSGEVVQMGFVRIRWYIK